jgi:hypothetical protein
METPLQKELEFFAANRAKWLGGHRGEFAVVRGEALLGFFPTFAAAYDAGVTEFGLEPFLIREVTETDQEAQFPALTAGLISARL